MTLKIGLQGFENLKDQYATDKDYAQIWELCVKKELAGVFTFLIVFYFKETNYVFLKDHLECILYKNSTPEA